MAASRPNRASDTAGRPISGSPRSRRRRRGRGTRRSRATARRPVQHDHARNRRERPEAAARRTRRRAASGRCAIPGTARRKICIRHGSRSFSTRRSTRSRRGRPGTKCCAIDRAIFCSTIWVSAKTTMATQPSPRLRRLRLLPARLFCIQDGAAVRLLELLARQRRQPPKCYQWFNIQHPEATRPPPPPEQITASADPTPAQPHYLQQMLSQPVAPPASAPAV